MHTVRHGHGQTAWSERLETEGVGIAALTTEAPSGTPEHGRQHHRRDCQPHPLNAVVVRQGHGRDCGPGGTTVLLPKAPVAKPWQPFDGDDDRRLMEHGCIKERTPPWRGQQPPQKTARAVRVHVLVPGRLAALAPPAAGPEPGRCHGLCPGRLRHFS